MFYGKKQRNDFELPDIVMELIASMLTLDDLVSLGQVGQYWAMLFDKALTVRIAEEKTQDKEGVYPIAQRKLLPRTRSISKNSEPYGGLLSIGKIYPRDLRYWYKYNSNTTSNLIPAFLADEIYSDWRQYQNPPTTLLSAIGASGFVPIIDWDGFGGLVQIERNRLKLGLNWFVNTAYDSRRHLSGNYPTAFIFYYSPYSIKSFSYMLNRIGELQVCRFQDQFFERTKMEGQFGDRCWSGTEKVRKPRFDRSPIIIVEVGDEVSKSCAKNGGVRVVPRIKALTIAEKLSCPLLIQGEGRVLDACVEEFKRMKPFLLERRTCAKPRTFISTE